MCDFDEIIINHIIHVVIGMDVISFVEVNPHQQGWCEVQKVMLYDVCVCMVKSQTERKFK